MNFLRGGWVHQQQGFGYNANKAEKIIQQSIIFPDFFTNPVSPIILLIDSISFQGAQFLL